MTHHVGTFTASKWVGEVDRRRWGRILVLPDDLFQQLMCDALYRIAFISTNVQHLPELNRFLMVGCSPCFRECADAEAIPEYQLLITTGATGLLVEVRVVEV